MEPRMENLVAISRVVSDSCVYHHRVGSCWGSEGPPWQNHIKTFQIVSHLGPNIKKRGKLACFGHNLGWLKGLWIVWSDSWRVGRTATDNEQLERISDHRLLPVFTGITHGPLAPQPSMKMGTAEGGCATGNGNEKPGF